MTKREEVRLACIDRAIAYFKSMNLSVDANQVARAAAEFEKFVKGSR